MSENIPRVSWSSERGFYHDHKGPWVEWRHVELLIEKLDSKREDAKDTNNALRRASDILTRITDVLKGPPDPEGYRTREDLPEIAAALKAKVEQLEEVVRAWKAILDHSDKMPGDREPMGNWLEVQAHMRNIAVALTLAIDLDTPLTHMEEGI